MIRSLSCLIKPIRYNFEVIRSKYNSNNRLIMHTMATKPTGSSLSRRRFINSSFSTSNGVNRAESSTNRLGNGIFNASKNNTVFRRITENSTKENFDESSNKGNRTIAHHRSQKMVSWNL